MVSDEPAACVLVSSLPLSELFVGVVLLSLSPLSESPLSASSLVLSPSPPLSESSPPLSESSPPLSESSPPLSESPPPSPSPSSMAGPPFSTTYIACMQYTEFFVTPTPLSPELAPKMRRYCDELDISSRFHELGSLTFTSGYLSLQYSLLLHAKMGYTCCAPVRSPP